ncbi:MAG: hypothetical protein CME61_06925 [Halobacteriovoraceae bacterium]|nr:hypothetical protein [Halobacteriovoraceae bacterium]|tara:strand:+ start:177 stop:635 length:459 start_codon:yes stop_codon:yes gene_type:complete
MLNPDDILLFLKKELDIDGSGEDGNPVTDDDLLGIIDEAIKLFPDNECKAKQYSVEKTLEMIIFRSNNSQDNTGSIIKEEEKSGKESRLIQYETGQDPLQYRKNQLEMLRNGDYLACSDADKSSKKKTKAIVTGKRDKYSPESPFRRWPRGC